MRKLEAISEVSLNLPTNSESHRFAQQKNRKAIYSDEFASLLEVEIQKLENNKKGEEK